ncbi:MAG: MFS transporter [Desulfobacterales bacterium]
METQEKASYRWPMLVYLSLINLIFNGIAVNIMPPLFPRISGELGLNYAQIGSIVGAIALGMMLFSLIGGMTADRFGIKNVIAVAVLAGSVFAGARGLAESYLALWVITFLMGVSFGFIIPNLTKGIAMWFGPEELGRANGILLIGVYIGVGMGFALGPPAAALLGGWRNVMFLSGAFCLVLSVVWLIAGKEREYTGAIAELMKVRPKPIEGLKCVFAVKEIWLLCITEVFVIGNLMAIGGIMPTYLVGKGMTETQAGVFIALNTAMVLIGLGVGPYLSDRVGLRKVFVWPFFLVSAITLPLFAVLWGWPLYLINIIGGFVIGCSMPQLRSIVMELEEIGPVLSGSAFGALFTFNRIGGFMVPWLMGIVMTSFGERIGFYFIAFLALIPPFLMLFVRETGRRARKT